MVGRRCGFDSKGYRILDRQVPDFDKLTSSDAIRMLKSRIIFNHGGFHRSEGIIISGKPVLLRKF